MAWVKRCWCLACQQRALIGQPVEVHHLLSGGVRRGHHFTIALCSWHHRGVPLPDMTIGTMRTLFGPSLALESKEFHRVFGSDDELLALQNSMLGLPAPDTTGVSVRRSKGSTARPSKMLPRNP